MQSCTCVFGHQHDVITAGKQNTGEFQNFKNSLRVKLFVLLFSLISVQCYYSNQNCISVVFCQVKLILRCVLKCEKFSCYFLFHVNSYDQVLAYLIILLKCNIKVTYLLLNIVTGTLCDYCMTNSFLCVYKSCTVFYIIGVFTYSKYATITSYMYTN